MFKLVPTRTTFTYYPATLIHVDQRCFTIIILHSILKLSSSKSIFRFLVKFLSPVLIVFVLFYAVSEGLEKPPEEEIPVEQEVSPAEEVLDA